MVQISDTATILMSAILSMDVYNRDSVYGSPELATRVGSLATGSTRGLATLETPDYDATTEFGATAWLFQGQTIIAYEGTIAANLGTIATSALNGYGIAFGSPYGPQATEAASERKRR